VCRNVPGKVKTSGEGLLPVVRNCQDLGLERKKIFEWAKNPGVERVEAGKKLRATTFVGKRRKTANVLIIIIKDWKVEQRPMA